MEKQKAKIFLSRIESYLLEHGISVDYGADLANVYWPTADMIEINTRQDYESRVYSLLHEAGHVRLRSSGDPQKKFPFMKKRLEGANGEYRRDMPHRIDVLREEVLAWESGEQLAFDLGIPLDVERWSKQRTKYITSYVKWTI